MKPFVNPKNLHITPDREHTPGVGEYDERVDSSFVLIPDLLSQKEIKELHSTMQEVEWIPVSTKGMQGDYQEGDPIGSWRMSSFQEDFSKEIFARVSAYIDILKECDNTTNTDWDGTPHWEAIGVNPLLRFIKYKDGGYLVPHYDAPYIADDEERTLMSLVIYLDNEETIRGGSTRFLKDEQKNTPIETRNLEDKAEPAHDSEVIREIAPEAGSAILFDHRLLHESHIVRGIGEKNIIRTDIMYRRA